MIFLCFSGKDRHTIIQSILYHIENYGLKIWYDNHQYLLGDRKIDKYTSAILSSKYAIVVFSNNFLDSPGAIEELEIIKEQYVNGKIYIFPVFYNISALEVPLD